MKKQGNAKWSKKINKQTNIFAKCLSWISTIQSETAAQLRMMCRKPMLALCFVSMCTSRSHNIRTTQCAALLNYCSWARPGKAHLRAIDTGEGLGADGAVHQVGLDGEIIEVSAEKARADQLC